MKKFKMLLLFSGVALLCSSPPNYSTTFTEPDAITMAAIGPIHIPEFSADVGISVEEPVIEDEIVDVVDRLEPKTVSRSLPLGSRGKFKTYMDYRTITNKSSHQYKLQQEATTDSNGFRKYNDKYMVAVGSHYSTDCGKEFIISLDSGIKIEVIIGDLKQDRHTDSSNMYVPGNGNIIEFIVDTSKLSSLSKRMGDVSYSGLEGDVINIEEVIIDD